ncbi:hypothetical protein DAI22_10g166736 [Oryza sativa Japonica Group]|nr:hypothetical protein DAI22_10g166736 [Oryza sativa Japonica Group]
MYDAYIIKKEYGAGSGNRTRNPTVMSLVSYQTVLSFHLYKMVKRALLRSSIPEIHTNTKGYFILTNWILLHPVTNMHKPFLEVCVRIAQSLDS